MVNHFAATLSCAGCVECPGRCSIFRGKLKNIMFRQLVLTSCVLLIVTSYSAVVAGNSSDMIVVRGSVSFAVEQTIDLYKLQGIPRENDEIPGDASAQGSTVNRSADWQARSVILLLVYCSLIVAASLIGGLLPSWVRLTHTRMQTMISFVGGLMLGIGVFHLMPHAVHELGNASATARWMMVGIVMMFVLIRLFHFHNHEPVSTTSTASTTFSHGHDHDGDHSEDRQPVEQHSETGKGHTAAECHSHGHGHGVSWMGIALGLSLHTMIDGLALAASVQADAQRSLAPTLLGLGTFLAVVLHKPLDAVSITSLMVNSGWSRRAINLVNAGFALMCPLGAVLFLLGISQFAGLQREFLGTALAFAAGVFICIALSDLLPEMEFHAHNKLQLTTALGLGIGLAWAITLLAPTHLH